MNPKLKAMIILITFVTVLYLPFAASAWGGYLFRGIPAPFEFTSASDSEGQDDQAGPDFASLLPDEETAFELAIIDQYGACVPKPELSTLINQSSQTSISIEEMRDHMHILEQGQKVTQCSGCHVSREEFCDRCHAYAGVNPNFEY